MTEDSLIPAERIEKAILLIRGQKVLLDRDLAELYEVPTKRLNEQVRRNRGRFPEDSMFQLSPDELKIWRSQFATSNSAAKMGLRRQPYAFTEQGVAMLSSALNSAGPSKSTSPSCGPSSVCARLCPRTKTWRASSTIWSGNSANMTRSSRSSSRQSGNSWLPRWCPQNRGLAFARIDVQCLFSTTV